MNDNKIQPTTIVLGTKANRLLKELAAENGMAPRFFFTKMIIREARSEATMLESDKLKERLALIDEVNDELVDLINHPPKEQLWERNTSLKPKSVYMKVWATHRRMKANGFSDEEIHSYCLDTYGIDFKIKSTPTKSPKRNPEWVGGGKVAAKIKEARENSRKIEVQDVKDLA